MIQFLKESLAYPFACIPNNSLINKFKFNIYKKYKYFGNHFRVQTLVECTHHIFM